MVFSDSAVPVVNIVYTIGVLEGKFCGKKMSSGHEIGLERHISCMGFAGSPALDVFDFVTPKVMWRVSDAVAQQGRVSLPRC